MKKRKILKVGVMGSLTAVTSIVTFTYYENRFSHSIQKGNPIILKNYKSISPSLPNKPQSDNNIVDGVLNHLNNLNETIYFGTNDGLKKMENGKLTIIDSMDLTNGFVYQTKDKAIYFGSAQGLKKYHNGKTTLISSFRFQFGYMLEADDGNLYVGSWGKGLNKIDGDKLVNISQLDVGGGFIYQTNTGTIYVGAHESGLRKLVKGQELKSIDNTSLKRGFSYQTKDKTVYIGTWANGLKKLVNDRLEFVNGTDVGKGFMYQVQDGTIYVGTYSGGLRKLVNGKLEIVDPTNMESGFMHQTQDGTIYVGTKDGSFKKLVNGKLESVNLMSSKIYFTLANQNNGYASTTLKSASTTLPSSLRSATTPAAIGFVDPSLGKTNGATVSFATKNINDNDGTLEVEATTTKGTVTKRMTFKLKGFQTAAQAKKMNTNIVNNIYSSFNILKNPQYKDVYVGLGKNGLKKLVGNQYIDIDPTNMESGFMHQTKDGTIYVRAADDSLKKLVNGKLETLLKGGAEILFMYEGKDGTIYLGTGGIGFKKIVNGKLEDAYHALGSYDALFMHEINDGTIYLANHDGKLEKFQNNRRFLIENINLEGGFFYQTQDGTIYVGTKSKGLKKLVNDSLVDIKPTDVGTGFMYQTQDGTIYVGTRSNGLKKLVNGNLINVDQTDVGGGFMYQTQDGTIYVGTKSKEFKKLVNNKLINFDSTNEKPSFIYQIKDIASTTLKSASTTLPSSLRSATTPAAIGFVDPSLGKTNGATVSFATKNINDNDGTLEVETTIKKGTVTKITTFKLEGFQTQAEASRIKADADQKTNETAINNWNTLAVSGEASTLPSNFGQIVDGATLSSATKLSLPTLSAGATAKITATPNNANGTISLEIIVTTPGATTPIATAINKVLTGFQTQAAANTIKADADQKTNETAINNWTNLAVSGATWTLPSNFSKITDSKTLTSLTGLSLPTLSAGATAKITATPNNANGTISLAIVVTTPGATPLTATTINKVLTGFQDQATANTINADADQLANETAINNWNTLAVSGEASTLPSNFGQIVDGATLSSATKLSLPTLSAGATAKITATPNNANGTISLEIIVTTPGATTPIATAINKVLTGFQTQAAANTIKADADQKTNETAINNWTTLAVSGATETLPTKIGSISNGATLTSLTGLSLPTLSAGATAKITATPNNANGTISLAIVINTPGATTPIATAINKVLTGFKTQADADQLANETAIKNWTTLAVSGATGTLPSNFGQIVDGATLSSATKLSLPTLSAGATAKITATPNNANGTISLAIVVTTPGATSPIATAINKVLTGFQTQGKYNKSKTDADQLANETAIKNWTTLAVSGATGTLPSNFGQIVDGATLSSATKLSLPTLSAGATAKITATPNNANGTISLAIVINTPGATTPIATAINKVLTGFQTQAAANTIKADADQKTNETAINNWTTLAVSGEASTLPSKFGKIVDGATLTSLTGLSLPTLSAGATAKITATPNNANGTISLAIVVTTPGATAPIATAITKVLTGFQDQATANTINADADQLANETAIKNWTTLAVSGATGTLPSNFGQIVDGATLSSATKLSLPTLSAGATAKITATPNNANGTISLAIVVTTPGATSPIATAINKVLTGFQTQAAANTIKADADQKTNETAINNWTTLAVSGEASTLPSKFGKIVDGATLSSATKLSLPTLSAGATAKITATPNNANGTISLAIVINTPGATTPIATAINKVLTGFQTQAAANTIKADADQLANETAIKNWTTLAVSGATGTLPTKIGSIYNGATLTSLTGLSLPTLSAGATAKITATPNNANGTISLAIVVTTPGATTPIATAINKVLTGFQTKAAANTIKADADQKTNETAINNWTTLAVSGEASTLPSNFGQIVDGATLTSLTGLSLPTLSAGATAKITATPNNANGTISLAIVVTTPGATAPIATAINKVLTGFQTQAAANTIKADADQQSNEFEINNNWKSLAVSGEASTLPSKFGKIVDGATLTSLTGLSLPTLSAGATAKITATPNNANGTISLAIVVTTPGATTPIATAINKVLTGFQTQADADQLANETAINNWNTLAVSGEASTLPSKFGQIIDSKTLTSLTGLSLPTLSAGATAKITATHNNANGTISLAIVVTTPGATSPTAPPIRKALTGFQTQANAKKNKADADQKTNETAINNWTTLSVSGATGTLPTNISSISNGATLTSLTKLSLPTLNGGATAKITATPNNANGTISLAIVINTPGATNSASNIIRKTLTGFQTQAAANTIKADADQKTNETAINNWTTLAVSGEASTLPSKFGKIVDGATLTSLTGLSLPTLSAGATAKITATPNNANGTISLAIVVTTPGATTPIATAINKVLTGFQTQAAANTIKADADQKTNETAINNWTTLAVSGEASTLPSNFGQIVDGATLASLTGLSLPTLSAGATAKITATPNNANGTISLAIVVTTPGATSPTAPPIRKALTGFQTQANAKKNKADADQKTNETAINNWTTLAVSGEASTLPSKFGKIVDGATLTSLTKLSLPTLNGGATAKITATPNNANGTISLEIIVTTPGATAPIATAITKVLTGFQTQAAANTIKADADQKTNETAIKSWTTLAVSGEASTLPSNFGQIVDGATLTSLTGLSLPTLSAGATAKITATHNNANGTISLAIVVTTPGATTPIATAINKVLTGFETASQKNNSNSNQKNIKNNLPSRLSRKAIIGISFGAISFLGIMIFLFRYLIKIKKSKIK